MSDILPDNTPQTDRYYQQDDDEINLGDLFITVLESKWLILSFFLIGISIGLFKAFRAIPIYETDVLLQIEKKSQSISALESIDDLWGRKVPLSDEIEIFQSRKILGETVENLNLEILAKPKYLPVLGEAISRRYRQHHQYSVSAPLFNKPQYAWGGETIQVDTFIIPNEWIGRTFILVAGKKGQFQLMDGKTILLNGVVGKFTKTQLEKNVQPVELFVSLLKARPGTEFTLVRQAKNSAIADLKARLTISAKDNKSWNSSIFEATLESVDPIMAVKTIDEITNIYLRNKVEHKSEQAQKTLLFLEKQLPLLKDQLEAATTALNEYRTQKGSIDLDVETQGVLSSVVNIKTQITLLQQKREEMRQRFTAQHPVVVAVNKQIARLQSQMKSLGKQIETLPETQQIIVKLSRDAAVTNELYTSLLNNAQTLRVAKAGTTGDARVIDYAVIPTVPIKPNKTVLIAISSIAGLMIGIVIAFVRKAFHKGIDDPNIIEKQLNIPVYATIPHSTFQESFSKKIKKRDFSINKPEILALEQKDDLAIESLRSLRTTLHFAFMEAKNNIIMITGPAPDIGKTFISINLATVLADAGKKILLIDGDMRRGVMNKALCKKREPGLSEIITDTITFQDAVYTIPGAQVDFISTGAIPPNPSELLMHENLGQLLEDVRDTYDYIIIDSPPILAVTDATIIGRMSSATLMVVKAGRHPIRELEQSIKKLTHAGIAIKGVVFNDMPEQRSQYGYEYGYGYKRYVYQYNYQKS